MFQHISKAFITSVFPHSDFRKYNLIDMKFIDVCHDCYACSPLRQNEMYCVYTSFIEIHEKKEKN